MPWWAWLVLGVVLLAAEIGVSADFWLAVVGAAAFGPALMGLLGFEGPVWVQWLVFAGLTVAFAVFARGPLYDRLMEGAQDLAPELLGERAEALEDIAPNATGQVSLRGSTWSARNEGDALITTGSIVAVESVEGVILRVRAL